MDKVLPTPNRVNIFVTGIKLVLGLKNGVCHLNSLTHRLFPLYVPKFKILRFMDSIGLVSSNINVIT
jgi:hypothetical protein